MNFQALKNAFKLSNLQKVSKKESKNMSLTDIEMVSINKNDIKDKEQKYYDDVANEANKLCSKIYEDLNAKNIFKAPVVLNTITEHVLSGIDSENIFNVLLGYSLISEKELIESIVNIPLLVFEKRKMMALHIMKCATKFSTKREIDIDDLKIELEIALEDKTRTIKGISDELIARVLFGSLEKLSQDEVQKEEYDIIETLESIAKSSNGQEVLENSIETLESENLKVTLLGAGRKYFISKEEVPTNNKHGKTLNAIKIALEKYLEEFEEITEETQIREKVFSAIFAK